MPPSFMVSRCFQLEGKPRPFLRFVIIGTFIGRNALAVCSMAACLRFRRLCVWRSVRDRALPTHGQVRGDVPRRVDRRDRHGVDGIGRHAARRDLSEVGDGTLVSARGYHIERSGDLLRWSPAVVRRTELRLCVERP